jgi:cytochrome c oxidase subunit 2
MASRSRILRILLAVAPSVLLIVLLSGFKIMGNGPLSTYGTAAGDAAIKIWDLYKLLFWISIPVFVIVQGVMLVALFKFKRKPGDPLPAQSHGNTKLEIVWTLIPAVVLAVIAVPTFQTIADLATPPGEDALTVKVYAQQWWWAFEYPEEGIVTAGVFHMPVDRPVRLEMVSKDVIHSFWIPYLAGKQDVVPGHTRELYFTPLEVGEYYGECQEYCGTQHANMYFRAVVDTPEDYQAWVAQEQQAAATPEPGSLAARGQEVFFSQEAGCVGCHAINGVEFNGTQALGTTGPNLTHFGSRDMIASGVLDNTPENLHKWIANTQAVKLDAQMPVFGQEYGGALSDDDIRALAAYLESLK